jgi:hypothetical protein
MVRNNRQPGLFLFGEFEEEDSQQDEAGCEVRRVRQHQQKQKRDCQYGKNGSPESGLV